MYIRTRKDVFPVIFDAFSAFFSMLHTFDAAFGHFTEASYSTKKTFVPEFTVKAGKDPLEISYTNENRGHINDEYIRIIYVSLNEKIVPDMSVLIDGTVYAIHKIDSGSLGLRIELRRDKWI